MDNANARTARRLPSRSRGTDSGRSWASLAISVSARRSRPPTGERGGRRGPRDSPGSAASSAGVGDARPPAPVPTRRRLRATRAWATGPRKGSGAGSPADDVPPSAASCWRGRLRLVGMSSAGGGPRGGAGARTDGDANASMQFPGIGDHAIRSSAEHEFEHDISARRLPATPPHLLWYRYYWCRTP